MEKNLLTIIPYNNKQNLLYILLIHIIHGNEEQMKIQMDSYDNIYQKEPIYQQLQKNSCKTM